MSFYERQVSLYDNPARQVPSLGPTALSPSPTSSHESGNISRIDTSLPSPPSVLLGVLPNERAKDLHTYPVLPGYMAIWPMPVLPSPPRSLSFVSYRVNRLCTREYNQYRSDHNNFDMGDATGNGETKK
ncbi:MAG: hypothetical protein Q9157_003243 [Trypethelium eluteriae]